jgi:hypothetical protein
VLANPDIESAMTRPLSVAMNRPIAILAYHFFPSSEVGAKRMNALATCFERRSEALTVFSAFEGLTKSSDTEHVEPIAPHVTCYRVTDKPSPVLALLVRIKKWLRAAKTRSSESISQRHPIDTSQAPSRSRLNRLFFDALYVIDNKKRWAFDALQVITATLSQARPKLLIVSGPPMSSLVAATLAGRRLGVPVLVDLRDPIYAEDAQTLAGQGVPVQFGRRYLERYVIQRAARVTTTSPTLRTRLQTRYPHMHDRIDCVYNGFDGTPWPARAQTDRRLVMIYAGSLYMNRDPFPLLEALETLVSRPTVDGARVEMLLVGDCRQYAGRSIEAWLSDKRSKSVVALQSRVEEPELRRLYERATLLLNFAEGQPMQIPAKTFELLSLGREILTFCEPSSDTALVVNSIEGVSCVDSRNGGHLLRTLTDLYDRHVNHGTLRAPSAQSIAPFSRASQNQRFLKITDEAIAEAGRPPRTGRADSPPADSRNTLE